MRFFDPFGGTADVSELKSDLNSVKSDVEAHINNNDIHVTASDKSNWNSKLDKNQGIENSGKVLGTNANGEVIPLNGYGFEYDEETKMLKYGTDPTSNLNQGIGLDDTLSKRGYAADAGAVGELKEDLGQLSEDKVNMPLSANGKPTNGTNGQTLRTKGDGTTEWTDVGLPTDAQTAQAVSDWLDVHPEATTTVQDGVITEPKIYADFLPYIKNEYVTPEMFGAVGDGATDDTQAFQNAINSGKKVVLANDYRIETITFDNACIVVGNSSKIYVNGTINITAGNVQISNVSFYDTENRTHTCFTMSESYGFILKNIIFNNFDKCVSFNGTAFWHTHFENIRTNESNTCFVIASEVTGIDNVFFQVYTNLCDVLFDIGNIQALFLSCNIGISANSQFITHGGSILEFSSCNFECDKQLNKRFFCFNSHSFTFINCKFLINGSASSIFFSSYDGMQNLILINCITIFITGNEMPTTNFFDRERLRAANYGGIIFIGGILPEVNPYSNGFQYYRDIKNNFVLRYYSSGVSLDTSKLKSGSVLYDVSTKKMQYFNGTEIVDFN